MRRSPGLPVAAVAAVAMLATGCSAAPPVATGSSSTESSPSNSSAPSSSSPSSSTSSRPRPTLPATPTDAQDAGTIENGSPTTVRGTDDRTVSYRVGGNFAVVVELDCSACSGRVLLTAEDRYDPWLDAPGPARVTTLENITVPDKTKHLVVRAQGSWQLRLSSWNDLPPKEGTRSGRNSAVFLLTGHAERLRLTANPAAGDSMQFRVRQAGQNQNLRAVGGDEPLDETIDMPLPAVVAIQGTGTWKVEPLS